jgi:glycyl-tRNA synthetase (class II)
MSDALCLESGQRTFRLCKVVWEWSTPDNPRSHDDAQAIGRRYRRQDEIGTPYCVTVDFDTLDDGAVTIRERDTMTQERIGLDKVTDYLSSRLLGC